MATSIGITKCHVGKGWNVKKYIYDSEGILVAEVADLVREPQEVEFIARFVTDAINGCVSVNPDSPQTVAESIGDVYHTLKWYVGLCGNTAHGVDRQSLQQAYDKAQKIFAKVERK